MASPGGVVEDVGLELPDGGARVDAELVGEPAPAGRAGRRGRRPDGRSGRARGPAAATRSPAAGVGRVPLQAAHRLDRRAEGQRRLGGVLDGDAAQLLEAGDLGGGPLLVRRTRCTASRARAPAPPRGRGGRARGSLGRSRQAAADQRFELPRVDLLVRQAQRRTRWRADQDGGRSARRPVRLEGLAQVRDVGLERARGARRRLAPPEVVRHPVGRDDRSAGGQQQPRARRAAAGHRGPPGGRRGRRRSRRARGPAARSPSCALSVGRQGDAARRFGRSRHQVSRKRCRGEYDCQT